MGVFQTIWLTRPDLRALCQEDPAELEYWLILQGRREYKGLEESNFSAHRDLAASGLTRLQDHLLSHRPDLQALFDIATPEGRQGFLWWYFFHGIVELDLTSLVSEAQKDFLCQADPGVFQDSSPPITRLMMELWRRQPELQQAHPLPTPAGRAGYVDWFLANGKAATGYGSLFDELAARMTRSPAAPVILPAREKPGTGVNLIGFARGEFGIGEDVRMAARSLQAASIPFSIYNIEPGASVSQGDRSVEAHISSELPYSVNLLCMTGIDTALLAANTGPALFAERHTIGFWPWELPHWPSEWHHAYDLVDEVWASSRYTYNAYAETCSKPVRHLPMAVTVDATDGLGRDAFGLPRDRFLFVFSFDGLSSLSRKNPLACIRAFRRAFPRGDEPVGLVLKAMRAEANPPAWQELVNEASQDRRISLITETFSRAKLLDLYRASDCFLSLHRAEGFGRCIAEAMMLGKPAIVTGHSGNLDFTTPGTAALVDHRIRPLTSGEYPFGEGQMWAEPDVEHAACWMRRMVEDEALRNRLSRRGQEAIQAYAPEVTGRDYAAILGTLNHHSN